MGIRIKAISALLAGVCACTATLALLPAGASAATPAPGWLIDSFTWPTNLSAEDSQNESKELTIKATGGVYQLRVFRDKAGAGTKPPAVLELTEALDWDAPASRSEEAACEKAGGLSTQCLSVEGALEDLALVGAGNVKVTGGPGDVTGSKPYKVAFQGGLSGMELSLSVPAKENLLELDENGTIKKGTATFTTIKGASAIDELISIVTNVGARESQGDLTVAATLPAGLDVVSVRLQEQTGSVEGACEIATSHEARCIWTGPVPVGVPLYLLVTAGVESATVTGSLTTGVKVSDEQADEATGRLESQVNTEGPAPFGIAGAAVSAFGTDGQLDTRAGVHPNALATIVNLNMRKKAEGGNALFGFSENSGSVKTISVQLPVGVVGDPLAVPQCAEADVSSKEKGTGDEPEACPVGSHIGASYFTHNGRLRNEQPVYDVVAEHGYPGELAQYLGKSSVFEGTPAAIPMYASVIRTAEGYRLRIASSDLSRVDIDGIAVVVYGEPDAVFGPGGNSAFLTNPTGCTSQPQTARVEADSWEEPENWQSAEPVAYPSITGCSLLQAAFNPTLQLEPEETHADTPSGYQVTLKVPQAPNVLGQLATPDLKNATVALPRGVSLSPAAASGPNALAGCPATGPAGINVGSNEVRPDGQDVGDPEATELGEGHPGGNNSPYDDGLWHTAPGHCPAKSQIGTVEVKTPLLSEPLKGHVYVAQPQCGGAGQPGCTPASAEDGQLYGIYLEMGSFEESGTIIKLKGKVSVNATTGQITTTFSENPQLPFEELKLDLSGGQRSALANPQTCGTYTTTSDLEPWSAPESGPNATPSWPFEVTGCNGAMAFKPAFEAGTTSTQARGSGAFTMTLTRNDGEQDIGGVSLTMPEGSAGLISKVTRCAEAQANAGTCPASSRIGTTHVAAGAGSLPLWLEGPVYLTGPYRGDPFGLSVVVPAKAGPYNLGNEVVRAGISVNPRNGQVSIASEPLRVIRDGVPFRIKELNVTVDKPGFIFNPTNCSQLAVTGTVSGDMPDGSRGSTVAVSNPFAVTGCKGLRFKPSFKAETHRFHSRKKGAFLRVRIGSGEEQANLAKVHVTLPKAMPSELSTLKLACSEAQFAANPAGCPKAAFVGNVVVHTPVLSEPLRGPAIFVSHASKKFPTLNFVLQGEGVTIIQEGETNIRKGFTSSSFNAIPDLPVKSIVVTLPETEKPALAGNGNFCKKKLKMPTTITGQNGAVIEKTTKIKVKGCKASRTKKKRKGGKKGKKGAPKHTKAHRGLHASSGRSSSGGRAVR